MGTGDIDALRARIRAQADAAGTDGWMDLPVPTGISPSGALRVPRGAFERWAVSRSGGDHLTIPWTAVSPPGLKLRGDDRYHSDWMIGAGLPLDAMGPSGDYPHREALVDAAYAGMSEVGERLLEHASSVLLPGPDVTGRVHQPTGPSDRPDPDPDGLPPVLVLRDAGPDFLELAVEALGQGGAVVVERGGQMAHLVTVLRADGRGPILRMDRARRLFPEGSLLCVSPSMGRVQLRDDGRASSGQGDAMPEPGTQERPTATVDVFFPAAGPRYAGLPETWPLRIVGEDELDRMELRDRIAARAEREGGPEPEPFELVPRMDGRPHPAERAGFMEPHASYEVGDLKVYANLHWDRQGDRERYVEFVVWETGPTEGRRARCLAFYAPLREWTNLGIRRGADKAILAARATLVPHSGIDEDDEPGMPAP